MPGKLDGTTKIFVGNFDEYTRSQEIRALFEKYGNVVECDIVRNYCFVHMTDANEAQVAISNLQGFPLRSRKLNVEVSTSEVRQKPGMGGSDKCFYCGDGGHWSRDCPKRDSGSQEGAGKSRKIYVGNVGSETSEEELKTLFSKFGEVEECSKVKNYAFVHMKTAEEATLAIEGLKGSTLNGQVLTIESSTSRPGTRGGPRGGGRGGAIGIGYGMMGGRGGFLPRVGPPMMDRFPPGRFGPGYRDRAAPYPPPPPLPAYGPRYDDRFDRPRGFEFERYDRMRSSPPMGDLYERRIPPVREPVRETFSAYDRYGAPLDVMERYRTGGPPAVPSAMPPAGPDLYSRRSPGMMAAGATARPYAFDRF